VVLNIGDVPDRRATNPLLRDHIKVPYMFGGVFVVLLAHENLRGRILEPANKLVTVFRLEVGLEDNECKVTSVSRFLTCSRRNSSWFHGLGRGAYSQAVIA